MRALAPLSLACVACGLAPISPDGAATLWWSVERDGAWSDEIFDLRAPGFVRRYEPAGDERLALSFFEEPLELLSVREGPIFSAPAGACRSTTPPRPARVYEGVGADLEPSARDVLAERGFVVELPCPCRELEITPLQAARGDVAAIAPRAQGAAYLLLSDTGTRGIELFEYRGGTVRALDVPVRAGAGCVAGDGRLYLPRDDGTMGIFTPDVGLSEAPPRATREKVVGVACLAEGAAVLDVAGAVHRYSAGAWRVLYDDPPVNGDGSNKGAILPLGGERLVLMQDDGGQLIYLDGDRVERRVAWGFDAVFDTARGAVEDLLVDADGALVMLTRQGNLLRDGGPSRDWSRFGAVPSQGEALSLESFIDVEGGYLLGSSSANVWEWNAALGAYCDPPRSVGDEVELRRIARLADGTVLVGGLRADLSGPGLFEVRLR